MRTSRKSSPRARRERPRLTATLEVTRISSPSAVMPKALRNRRARSLLSFSATSSPTGTSTCAVSIRAVTVRARLRAAGGRAVVYATLKFLQVRDAGWSSPVARWAHNPKVAGSNPAPANPFNRSSIVTTVAAPRSCGHDLNLQMPPFARSGFSGSSHDTDRRQENGCFKNIEDLREARASMSIANKHAGTGVPLRAWRE